MYRISYFLACQSFKGLFTKGIQAIAQAFSEAG